MLLPSLSAVLIKPWMSTVIGTIGCIPLMKIEARGCVRAAISNDDIHQWGGTNGICSVVQKRA